MVDLCNYWLNDIGGINVKLANMDYIFNQNSSQDILNIFLGIYATKFKKKLSLAIDIGANIGNYSNVYCDFFDKVIGVEPNKECNIYLDNIKNKKNYTYYNLGLCDKECIKSYYKLNHRTNTDGCNTFSIDYLKNVTKNNQEYTYDLIDIECTALDSLNIHDVDFIKIDVEGLCNLVVNGAMLTIKNYKPVIQAEKDYTRNQSVLKVMESLDYIKIETHDSYDNVYVYKNFLH